MKQGGIRDACFVRKNKRTFKMPDTRFANYFNPVVEAINALGGSARPQEVYKYIAKALNLSDQILNEEKKR
jgi:hypothetical protein